MATLKDPSMQRYLNYYKVTNKHPYYVFFRPYHLRHLETPRAIALAALFGKAVCTMRQGRETDTFAYAKKDLKLGDKVQHAIGGNEISGCYEKQIAAVTEHTKLKEVARYTRAANQEHLAADAIDRLTEQKTLKNSQTLKDGLGNRTKS